MNVRVNPTSGEDLAFPSNGFGAWPDHNGDAFLDVGVACFADAHNAAVLQAYIGLNDAPPIENEGIRNHGVNRSFSSGGLRLPHTIANHFAASELHFIAVSGVVLLHLED